MLTSRVARSLISSNTLRATRNTRTRAALQLGSIRTNATVLNGPTHGPNHVTVVEVGPRDGLQNEHNLVPANVKIELIERLARAGLRHIEAGSFVSPKWVPQMADTEKVVENMERLPNRHYPVLVPNMKGLDKLLEILEKHMSFPRGTRPPTEEIAIFAAATDVFSKANINCSIKESLENFDPVVKKALDHGLRVRGYVSVVITCPFTGEVDPKQVKAVTKALLDIGCYEVSLGDTVGTGNPTSVTRLLETLMGGANAIPPSRLAGHFHDTYGCGVANVHTALSMGIRTIDAAVGGLGGCPYSPGATGNVSTEDVIYSLKGSKYTVDGDFETLAEIGAWISEQLKRDNESKAGRAYLATQERIRLEKERENDGGSMDLIEQP